MSEQRVLVIEEVVDQRGAVIFAVVLDQCRAVVVAAWICARWWRVVHPGLVWPNPPAQPVGVLWGMRQSGEQQPEHAREDQDDAQDVYVQPVQRACWEGKPQDGAGRGEEDARAGPHRAPSGRCGLTGLDLPGGPVRRCARLLGRPVTKW